mmetsp:Transcript_25919/g.83957  ORF Transcript_25919/g.83957 Transcript_25919/m.83957 type:complete len:260 (+) Transcript_25919:1254-2033(+)
MAMNQSKSHTHSLIQVFSLDRRHTSTSTSTKIKQPKSTKLGRPTGVGRAASSLCVIESGLGVLGVSVHFGLPPAAPFADAEGVDGIVRRGEVGAVEHVAAALLEGVLVARDEAEGVGFVGGQAGVHEVQVEDVDVAVWRGILRRVAVGRVEDQRLALDPRQLLLVDDHERLVGARVDQRQMEGQHPRALVGVFVEDLPGDHLPDATHPRRHRGPRGADDFLHLDELAVVVVLQVQAHRLIPLVDLLVRRVPGFWGGFFR